jgi:phage shock protein E
MRHVALGLCLTALTMVLLAGCSLQTAHGSASKGQFATIPVDRYEQMSRQPGVVLLDVRTPAEFAQGHIPGAVNIDVEADDFAQKIAALNKNATYLVNCRSGKRAARACGDMAGLDFAHVYNLEGGINAWTVAGKPVEK